MAMIQRRQHDQKAAVDKQVSLQHLAKIVTRLFVLWDLDSATQLNLLGLSRNSRALLPKYRNGKALPSNRDTLDRVGWLLSIHKALRLLYPHNPELRHRWIKTRNLAFDHLTPLEVMDEHGLIGIARVARYLDYQRGQ